MLGCCVVVCWDAGVVACWDAVQNQPLSKVHFWPDKSLVENLY